MITVNARGKKGDGIDNIFGMVHRRAPIWNY
jgi:hypothetical protein